MLVSKIGRPWTFHVFAKNTLVSQFFYVEGNLQKIWNFVEILSTHMCSSVLIFMFLLLIVLLQWLNQFEINAFGYSVFMPQHVSGTCFNKHYGIIDWSTLFRFFKFILGLVSEVTAFWSANQWVPGLFQCHKCASHPLLPWSLNAHICAVFGSFQVPSVNSFHSVHIVNR